MKYEDAFELAVQVQAQSPSAKPSKSQIPNALTDLEDVIALLRKSTGYVLSSENAERMIEFLTRK